MGLLQRLTDERFAKPAAKFLKLACYFIICVYAAAALLSFMGRQTFYLHAKTGSFENAICAEEDHAPASRGMTMHLGDEIHVWTDANDQIAPAIRWGLSAMAVVTLSPLMLAFWFLSRVFSGIQNGRIFTEQNAACLLYYGLLQGFAAAFVPFLKLGICRLASLAADGRIDIATGQDMLGRLVPAVAVLVAAYIIHYGAYLQDEVDHTL